MAFVCYWKRNGVWEMQWWSYYGRPVPPGYREVRPGWWVKEE